MNEICPHFPAFPQTGIKFGTGDAKENVLSNYEFVKIVAVKVLMHKLDFLWRSRNKLAEYFIVEIDIINVTWFKFGMSVKNKIVKTL
jgi:hypothetical protein